MRALPEGAPERAAREVGDALVDQEGVALDFEGTAISDNDQPF
jgi:hypothetical protein